MFNFLSVAINTYSGFGMPFELNWIGNIIKWLIDGCGSIGLGIILFTVILKLITLPLDIISRVSTKKNSLKMEKMRPQLEKLQRQYANDKALYNQKMQALYKKEGYSMFSTCLPMIVTIVVFIIVINQFTAYSRYTNLSMINSMASAYTNAIVAESEVENSYVTVEKNENDEVVAIFVDDGLFDSTYCADLINGGIEKTDADYYLGSYVTSSVDNLGKLVLAYNEKGYDRYLVSEKFTYDEGTKTYSINYSAWDTRAVDENGNEAIGSIRYLIKQDKAAHNVIVVDLATITDAEIEQKINSLISESLVEYSFEKYVDENVKQKGRDAAAEYYASNAPKFLWVKNLWVPDLPWKHPVFSELSEYDFYSSLSDANKAKEAEFKEITAALSEEKNQPNGYLILVILSIGVMLLSQLIMNKTQKAQMELQSVDGQAANTSKMMTWMMPIMFGFFAFIYTASFSLYMIVSSVLSTLSTIITNYFVEKNFKKKMALEDAEKDKRKSYAVSDDNNSKKKKK